MSEDINYLKNKEYLGLEKYMDGQLNQKPYSLIRDLLTPLEKIDKLKPIYDNKHFSYEEKLNLIDLSIKQNLNRYLISKKDYPKKLSDLNYTIDDILKLGDKD